MANSLIVLLLIAGAVIGENAFRAYYYFRGYENAVGLSQHTHTHESVSKQWCARGAVRLMIVYAGRCRRLSHRADGRSSNLCYRHINSVITIERALFSSQSSHLQQPTLPTPCLNIKNLRRRRHAAQTNPFVYILQQIAALIR